MQDKLKFKQVRFLSFFLNSFEIVKTVCKSGKKSFLSEMLIFL